MTKRSVEAAERRIRKEVVGWLRATYVKKSLRAEVNVDEDTLDDGPYFWAYIYDGKKLVAEGSGWFEQQTDPFDEMESDLNEKGYRRIPLRNLIRED
ncbi:MAG TPA: hypothetical protein VGG32_07020 [Thermoplasmata archaeon]|jgi:hypothetical protein